MRRVAVFASIVAFSASVFAADALIYKDGSLSIRLTQEPCVAPVADLIRAELLPSVKRADVVFQGNALRACWRANGENVEIVDETGDGGVVPMAVFKVDSGA